MNLKIKTTLTMILGIFILIFAPFVVSYITDYIMNHIIFSNKPVPYVLYGSIASMWFCGYVVILN